MSKRASKGTCSNPVVLFSLGDAWQAAKAETASVHDAGIRVAVAGLNAVFGGVGQCPDMPDAFHLHACSSTLLR